MSELRIWSKGEVILTITITFLAYLVLLANDVNYWQLPFVCIGFFSIMWFRNRTEKRNRATAEAAEATEKEKVESLKALCKQVLERFVAAYRNTTSVWPSKPYIFEIPEDDKKAFITILARDEGVNVDMNLLNRLLSNEMNEQAAGHFKQSFIRLNPKLPKIKEPKDWAKAYVNTFGNNYEYVQDALSTAKSINIDLLELRKHVTEEIEYRKHNKRVGELKKTLNSGKSLFKKVTISEVDLMTGVEFEKFLEKLFAAMGYKVERTKITGDQGADLVIEKFGERTAVQAKCYSDKVGNSAIQEVVAAKSYYNASGTMVVINDYFTDAAKKLATANKVELWDRNKLEAAINSYL